MYDLMGDKFKFCEIFCRVPETRCNNLSWSLHHAMWRHYAVRRERDRFYFKENNFPCRYTTLTHWLTTKPASLLAYCLQMFVLIARTSCLSVGGGKYCVDLTFKLRLISLAKVAHCLQIPVLDLDYKKLILRDCQEKLLTDISNVYLEFA